MFVILSIFILILLYIRGTKNFKYWEKKGIQYCKPVPFFGNSLRKYLQKISPTDQVAEVYRNFPTEKCVGCFESNYRSLVLRDPEMIKHVLVSDFVHFFPKGINEHGTEPLLNNLFTADGDLWKLLRQKLTAAFTTGKFKAMFPVLLKQTERLDKIIFETIKNDHEVNVRDLMARYTTDVIASCGFGVDSNSLNDETSVFRKLGKRIFDVKLRDNLVSVSKSLASGTFKNFRLFSPEVESTIGAIVKNIIDDRGGKPKGRKDFMDVLIEMQNKKRLVGESFTRRDQNGEPVKCEVVLDEDLIAAQAFILFGAGYETSAASMSFTLNQLAYNPEIQKKCQQEIDEVLERHGGLTFAAVNEMKYLEMAFKEGLRMYPPIGFLVRVCAKDFTFPETNLTINQGVVVLVSLQAMQNDEKYFEKPDEFIPERFHPDNAKNLTQFSYLPFGAGPRTCIGQRFGFLQSLAGLATVLSKYSVVPSENSRRKHVTDPTIALVQNIKGGIPLKFELRTTPSVC